MSKVKSFAEIMSEEYAQKLQTIDEEPDQEEKDFLLALRLSQQEAEQENIKLLSENNVNNFPSENNNENNENNENNNENNENNDENYENELKKKAEEDFVYALQLQEEFDKQKEDEDVRYMQVNSRQNNFSKVAISFDRFRSIPSHSLTDPYSDDDDNDDEELDENDEENDLNKEKNGNFRAERSVGINTNKQYGGRVSKEKFTTNNIKKEITTKHDPLITGKLNAIILDNQLANNFGNLEDLNTPISNLIYTSLKTHADKVETRRIRFHGKEDRETREHVMDPRTRILLYKMLNNSLLSEVGGILSTGKEANVYLGLTDNLPNHLIIDNNINNNISNNKLLGENIGEGNPGFYAIKIYKTTLNEFKNRDLYLKYDYRFRFKHNKQNPRKFIAIWAEKERDNLLRLKNIGIVCPEVILLRKHILVLQFIGDRRGVKAPHLKDAITALATKEIDQLYKECAIMMRNMYQRAKLVHADLSEYNLLYYQWKLFVIDLAQAVENEHPFALAFLKRDCENINRFFDCAGASFVMSTKELFLFIVTEHFNAMNDVIFGPTKKQENNDVISESEHVVFVKIDDVSLQEGVKEKKNVKKRKDDVIVLENFWKRLERMAKERGEISDNLKRDDEVFLNGFLPRTLADIDDISLPTSSFISSQYLTENYNDEEEEDEEEFDAEYEVKEWEERPKFSKEDQKLLRKEAKRRYKESKRSKRPIKPSDQPKSDNNDNNDNDNDNNNDNNDVDAE